MWTTVETGDIFFLYTPRSSAVRNVSEVHELGIILSPDDDHPRRLLVIGDRHLPTPDSSNSAARGPVIAEVVDVRERPEELVSVLEARAMHGHGKRYVAPPSRPCGEGRYVLAIHDDHAHLSYALELPRRSGEVQRDLGLARDASYRLTIRLPAAARMASSVSVAAGFTPVTDRGQLDHAGCELLLESVDERDVPPVARDVEGPATAEIFGELKLVADRHPTEPLYEGRWK